MRSQRNGHDELSIVPTKLKLPQFGATRVPVHALQMFTTIPSRLLPPALHIIDKSLQPSNLSQRSRILQANKIHQGEKQMKKCLVIAVLCGVFMALPVLPEAHAQAVNLTGTWQVKSDKDPGVTILKLSQSGDLSRARGNQPMAIHRRSRMASS
jgi:hypothetical protein